MAKSDMPVVIPHAASLIELRISHTASFNETTTNVNDSAAVFGDFVFGNASHEHTWYPIEKKM